MNTATATMNDVAPIILWANTAGDLMTANPVSVRADVAVKDAAKFLILKGFSAAPVIDEAGRPIGVVSQADIVMHNRGAAEHDSEPPQPNERRVAKPSAGKPPGRRLPVEKVDRIRVRDIMMPAIFSVPAHAPVARVIEEMLALRVHRLFVIGKDGVLTGVISAVDILRRLRPEPREDGQLTETASQFRVT